ncbi:MAG: hypothetical protein RIC87_17445 [Kiloniellales bacterium]
MSPTMIILAVKGIIRLGNAGIAAYEQAVVDREIRVFHSRLGEVDLIDRAIAVLSMPEHADRLLTGDLAHYWKGSEILGGRPVDAAAELALIEAAEEIWDGWMLGMEPVKGERLLTPAGSASVSVLRQWAKDEGPPSPAVRMALAMGEVALELVSAKPDLFADTKGGQQMLNAFANSLSSLLPDPDDPQDWDDALARKTLTIVFRAGLEAVAEHPDAVTDEAHLQALTGRVAQSFRKGLTEDPENLFTWLHLRDNLLGPAAKASFDSFLEHPDAFFGEAFAAEGAMGAVSQAFFKQLAKEDLEAAFSKQSLIALYRSLVSAVAERPDLLLGDGQTPAAQAAEDQAAEEMLAGILEVLKQAGPPFDRRLAAQLFEAAASTLPRQLPIIVGVVPGWGLVIRNALAAVIEGVQRGRDPNGLAELDEIFDDRQALAFAKLVFREIARTPGLVLPDGSSPELRTMVAAVTRSLSQADRNLLSAEAWLEVAEVAFEEAARNPARLFDSLLEEPDAQLGVQVVRKLLSVAKDALVDGDRSGGQVLFGETLKEAIIVSLKAVAADTTKGAELLPAAVGALAMRLNTMISKPESRAGVAVVGKQIGARQWLWLFRALVADVVAAGKMPPLSDAQLLAMLQKG